MSAWHELLANAYQENEADNYAQATQLAGEALDALVADLGWDAARHMSRLLRNAIYYATERRPYKCPRCEIEILEWVDGEDRPRLCAISRTSRDDHDAPIPICRRCGEREAIMAAMSNPDKPERWRTGDGVPPPPQWPVSVDQLLEEDRCDYLFRREAKLETRRLGELGEDA